jgi:hypothetical protein
MSAMDEYWVAEIVYSVQELKAMDPVKRGNLQARIDSGDLILSGGEVSAPLVCYEGERGTPASKAAHEEALGAARTYAQRGRVVKVIANLDVETV